MTQTLTYTFSSTYKLDTHTHLSADPACPHAQTLLRDQSCKNVGSVFLPLHVNLSTLCFSRLHAAHLRTRNQPQDGAMTSCV